MDTPIRIIIPVPTLAAALKAAADRDVRYYLNGVFVRVADGRVEVVATNGHVMFVQALERATAGHPMDCATMRDGLILEGGPLGAALKSLKAGKHSEAWLEVDPTAGKAHLTDYNRTIVHALDIVAGKYPDYARVIRAGWAERRGAYRTGQDALSAEYLAMAAAIAKILGSKGLCFNGPAIGSASMFTFTTARDALFVVMPMRGEESISDELAALVRAPKPADEAEAA